MQVNRRVSELERARTIGPWSQIVPASRFRFISKVTTLRHSHRQSSWSLDHSQRQPLGQTGLTMGFQTTQDYMECMACGSANAPGHAPHALWSLAPDGRNDGSCTRPHDMSHEWGFCARGSYETPEILLGLGQLGQRRFYFTHHWSCSAINNRHTKRLLGAIGKWPCFFHASAFKDDSLYIRGLPIKTTYLGNEPQTRRTRGVSSEIEDKMRRCQKW